MGARRTLTTPLRTKRIVALHTRAISIAAAALIRLESGMCSIGREPIHAPTTDPSTTVARGDSSMYSEALVMVSCGKRIAVPTIEKQTRRRMDMPR